MPQSVFLASLGLDALPEFLNQPPSILQLLYIPTAANVDELADHAHTARAALAEMGFQIDDLDLATASAERVKQAVVACDVVYVGGGNTYYLLDWVNRSGLREALSNREDLVYVGSSAGAIIAGQDIAYIGDADDPSAAPDLESTAGLAFTEALVMPHANEPSMIAKWDEVIANHPHPEKFVRLNDDQALTVVDGKMQVVSS